MQVIIVSTILIGLPALFFCLRAKARAARRAKLFATPPPESWFPIIGKNLPVYGKLSDDLKRQLHSYMQVFLGEKKFEGCGGLELTEEIRLTVAAQACMLLLNREVPCYPKLKTILMYPHAYVSGRKGMFGGDNGEGARLGESWGLGVVVLAWDSVKGGAINFEDGHNVTFHEFAHQLDQADGVADGAPILPERSAYSVWARVLSKEYDQLCKKTRKGKKSTMDRYGATNPAEFFAVATETFFEKPRQLKERHPELYEELQYYYRVDPVVWVDV